MAYNFYNKIITKYQQLQYLQQLGDIYPIQRSRNYLSLRSKPSPTIPCERTCDRPIGEHICAVRDHVRVVFAYVYHFVALRGQEDYVSPRHPE